MTFFPFCPGRAQFVNVLARFRFCSCVAVWVRFGPLPEICLRLRCGWFFRVFRCFFFDTVFANLKRDLLKIPSLLFVFCSFAFFLLELGSTRPCTCVLGQFALNLFFCLSVYKNTVFPPEKGLFLFISLCLPFFLLGFLHFSFSFPVSLFLLFFFCPSLFFLFFL